MRIGAIGWGILSLAVLGLSGCVGSESTPCGQTVCGPGLVCAEVHELCVNPSQLVDCVGVADGELCDVLGVEGFHCDLEVCVPGECGDEVADSTEECDYGAWNSDIDPDACRTDCTAARCGDGVADTGEECDEGVANSDTLPDVCRTTCLLPVCGDTILDTGEECDDGNATDWDGCNACGIGELQINEFQSNGAGRVAVASATDGAFVVVWANQDQDGDNWGVFGRRYDASGRPQSGEFQVNSHTLNGQYVPQVAMAGDGRFVVVWMSTGQDGDSNGIFAQRYSATGAPEGAEFQVNSFTAGSQASPKIAMAADAGFVVVWSSRDQDGDGNGVYGQRYSSTGSPLGGEFLVNDVTASDQAGGLVAVASDGRFMVVWNDGDQLSSEREIFARLYAADGSPVGGSFSVNTYTPGLQAAYSVAVGADGRFVVAWVSMDQDGDGAGIFARVFDAGGTAMGAEIPINVYTTSSQSWPSVGMAGDGGFAIAWASDGQDGDGDGIFFRRFSAAGVALGGEVPANLHTAGDQAIPALAMTVSGEIVVAWSSNAVDVDGILAQRFDAAGSPLGVDP